MSFRQILLTVFWVLTAYALGVFTSYQVLVPEADRRRHDADFYQSLARSSQALYEHEVQMVAHQQEICTVAIEKERGWYRSLSEDFLVQQEKLRHLEGGCPAPKKTNRAHEELLTLERCQGLLETWKMSQDR
jgi:hypothetical protein